MRPLPSPAMRPTVRREWRIHGIPQNAAPGDGLFPARHSAPESRSRRCVHRGALLSVAVQYSTARAHDSRLSHSLAEDTGFSAFFLLQIEPL